MPLWAIGIIVAGGVACVDAVACWASSYAIIAGAIGEANNLTTALYPNELVHNATLVGVPGDALKHCIGSCRAAQHPGACLSSAIVRGLINGRETHGIAADDMDLANNNVGFGITGNCVTGCANALLAGRLTCISGGALRPCPQPTGALP
jgi:hypothetical protein